MSYRINPRSKNDEPRDAMLTENQREFLRSDGSGYTKQNKYDYRKAIRERVWNTILDFQLLFEHWREEQREEVFRETIGDNDLRDGLASFIALVYMENRFESGLERLVRHGVTKAEKEMADSDLHFPINVDLSITHVEQADYERLKENFSRSGRSTMSDGEAQALGRLVHRAASAEEVEEMISDTDEPFEDFARELNEAKMQRTDYAREKQASYRQTDDE